MSPIDFFNKNEQAINKQVIRILYALWPINIIIILCKYFSIFKRFNYISGLIIIICVPVILFFLTIIDKKHPESKSKKYIILLVIELYTSYLSKTDGLEIFLTYLIVPILSLLYYNRKFTLTISTVCFIIMLESLFYRAFARDSAYFGEITRLEWLKAYGTGMSIEYLISVFIMQYVAKFTQNTVEQLNITQEKEEEKSRKLKDIQRKITAGFANLVESRDESTGEHIKRTSAYVILIMNEMKKQGYYAEQLTEDMKEYIANAAPLHDLGKIQIPDRILTAESTLTQEEYEEIKKHTTYGEKLIRENLSYFDEAFLKVAKDVALYHHERWDGKGYPKGLKGLEIPLSARIMATADVLDALLNKRCYKDAFPMEKAIEIMKEGSGTQFDEFCIKALLECIDDIKRIHQSFTKEEANLEELEELDEIKET